MNKDKLVFKVAQKQATFELANTLKSYCQKVLKDKINNWIIDLSDCDYCDSTFLGTLLLCTLDLSKSELETKVTILNSNSTILSALAKMGIDRFFEIK